MFARKKHLKRELSLTDLVMYGLSIIVGAGIYSLIGKAAGISGNSLWLSFVFAGFIAIITGLSYAELSSIFPRNAAEYTYTREAFLSKRFSFSLSWLIIFIGAVAASTIALGFGGYFEALIGTPLLYNALGLIIVLSILGMYGLRESMEALYAMTIATLLGLLAIVAYSWKYIGTVNYFEMPNGISGVLEASAFVFFAYLGFEAIANMSEETRNPKRVVPRAILISIAIATVIYIIVAISSVSAVSWNVLSASNAPVTDIASKVMPNASFIITIIALFATASTVLTFLIASSRRIYGMTEEHSLPGIFAYVHPKQGTPCVAILSFAVIASLFTLINDISFVAKVANFGSFLIFGVVHISLIELRYREPHAKRKYRVPLNIGKFPLLAGVGIVLSSIMMFQFSLFVALISAVIFFSGALVYSMVENISKMIVFLSKVLRIIYELIRRKQGFSKDYGH